MALNRRATAVKCFESVFAVQLFPGLVELDTPAASQHTL